VEESAPKRLELIRPANLTLRGDRLMTDLYRTRFEGRAPNVREAGDTVTLEYPRFAYGKGKQNRAAVTLRGDVPWRIECRGAVTSLRADLGAIKLQAFDIHAGASRILVTLPTPMAEVPIRLASGVEQATFQRPVGVAARVHIGKGAAGLSLDDQRFKAVGGEVNWQSPDWDRAANRYAITVLRGVHEFTVETVQVVAAGSTARTGRALTTVVFTDIVRSTERAREVGDRRWRELLDLHDAAASRLVEMRGGELVKTTKDGVLALFDRPGEAIGFARALRDESARDLRVDIRAGVHTGEVEYRGTDVGGIGVHIGARIMDIAGPGEILVSRTVRDLIAGSDLDLQDHGTHALRGIGDRWQVFSVR